MVLSFFVYQTVSFNQLSHRKSTNGKIQTPFITFNVIAKNVNKNGITLLS